jgi:UDP-glucose 4-epimerase
MGGKRILVTGGSGFVGTHLIKNLLKEHPKNKIISIDDYSSGTKDNNLQDPRVKYYNIGTYELELLDKHAYFEPNEIYHFGEFSRVVTSFDKYDQCWKSNIIGTNKVLQYAVKHKAKFFYSASSSGLGNGGEDESLSPYAWMKSKNVELIKNYNKWFGLQYNIYYFYNVYGPGQIESGEYATVIGIFERLYRENKPLSVVSPGTQTRDFTHIQDIIEGIQLGSNVESNDEYWLGTGKQTSILEICKTFKRDYVFIPERIGERVAGEAPVEATMEKLNWQPNKQLSNYIEEIINHEN